MVALQRLDNANHCTSGVMLAKLIGTISGLKFVKFNHDRPDNLVDRVRLAATIVPTANGTALTWAITPSW
ncbi:MAG: hypothetical protein M3Z05_06770 [Gemmatimonadota bacterium]|nr:hypothetical protein [Gemmatimonadota bacterium]